MFKAELKNKLLLKIKLLDNCSFIVNTTFFKSMNDQHKFLDNKKPLSGLFIEAILS